MTIEIRAHSYILVVHNSTHTIVTNIIFYIKSELSYVLKHILTILHSDF